MPREVHKNLGPGLLESIYEECLIEELVTDNLEVKSQISIPVSYKGKKLKCNFKIDLIVNYLIIVELKSVDTIIPVFKVQLLTYLKLTNKLKGLLINLNCENITNQLIPLVTDEFSKLNIE